MCLSQVKIPRRGFWIPEPAPSSDEIEARFVHLKQQAVEAIQLLPQAPNELLATVQNIGSPGALADMVATIMDATPDECVGSLPFSIAREGQRSAPSGRSGSWP